MKAKDLRERTAEKQAEMARLQQELDQASAQARLQLGKSGSGSRTQVRAGP